MLRLFPLLYSLVATVLSGAALTTVLLIPSWNERATHYIPGTIGIALLISIPIAWLVARQILSLTRKS
jgi:nitrogen fixation/metabolism regulation signal transduction histidine kinase